MIIGVTGPIGSGKSTVSKILSNKGFPIIDADGIAHEILEEDDIKKTIMYYFGNGIVDSNGDIDRKELGKIIFKDEGRRKLLNQITHPRITEEIKKRIEIAKSLGVENIILDVPLPLKDGFVDQSDFIIAVLADENIRQERIMKRNNLEYGEALNRVKSQDIFEYLRIADGVITNNGDMTELENTINEMYDRITEVYK